MTGMDMGRFKQTHDKVSSNAGENFGDIPKLVVQNGVAIRLIGDFESAWEHFLIGPQGNRPYYCGGPDSGCPICTLAGRLAASDDEEDQKKAQKIKAKERFYFNALDRTDAGKAWHTANKKAKVLSQTPKGSNVGSMLFRAIGEVCAMRESQGQEADPNTYDIVLSKKGSGMNTEYGAQFSGMTNPLTDEEKAYELWPLKKLAKLTPNDTLQAVADWLEGKAPATQTQTQTQSTTQATAAGPVEAQGQVQPAAGPQPAVAPNTVNTQQQTEQPQKLTIKPKPTGLQDTSPREGENIMQAPCSSCGADMFIDMEDERDLKCHNCGKTYTHPNKA